MQTFCLRVNKARHFALMPQEFFLSFSRTHSEGAHRCKLGFARLCISRTKLSEQPQQFFVFMIRPLTQHTLLQSLCIHLSHINSSLCSSVTLTRKSIFIFFFSSLLCFTHIRFPFLHLSTAFLSTIYSVFFSPSFTAILSISQPNSFAFSSFSASPGESALDNFLLC